MTDSQDPWPMMRERLKKKLAKTPTPKPKPPGWVYGQRRKKDEPEA